MPTSFNVNQTNVFLRLALTDESRYDYNQKHRKITLPLNNIILVLNLETA